MSLNDTIKIQKCPRSIATFLQAFLRRFKPFHWPFFYALTEIDRLCRYARQVSFSTMHASWSRNVFSLITVEPRCFNNFQVLFA